MAVAVGDLFKVTYKCRMGNQAGLNVRYYAVASFIGVAPSQQEMTDALSAAVAPKLKALMTSQASYDGLECQLITAPPNPVPTVSVMEAGVGTAGDDPLPSNVCGIFTTRTGFQGRANRGRTYIPFPDEADNTGTLGFPAPTVGYATRAQLYAAFHKEGVELIIEVGTRSVVLDAQIVTGGTGPGKTITSTLFRFKWATQHRRGSYGAPNFTIA